MPRIAEAELHRLKTEVSLERLCQRYGIALSGTGKNLAGKSPWREETDPSFMVTPSTNLWNDMGVGAKAGTRSSW